MRKLYIKLKDKMHFLWCRFFGKELTIEYLENNNYQINGHVKVSKSMIIEKPVTFAKNSYLLGSVEETITFSSPVDKSINLEFSENVAEKPHNNLEIVNVGDDKIPEVWFSVEDGRDKEVIKRLLLAIEEVDGRCRDCQRDCIDGFIEQGLVDADTINKLAEEMGIG